MAKENEKIEKALKAKSGVNQETLKKEHINK
jgi:hypothetical protein